MSDVRYWCLLDEQPHYLVPADPSAPCLHGALALNPECRFSWMEDGATGDLPDFSAVPAFLPAECIAWVPDAATGAIWPYWVGYEHIDALVGLTRGRLGPLDLPAVLQTTLLLAGILVQPAAEAGRRRQARQDGSAMQRQFHAGFTQWPRLIPPFHLGALRRYYRQCVRAGAMALGDGQVESRYAAHNEPVSRFIQRQLTRAVAAIARRPVKPSYSYVITYRPGSALAPHTDREQCEYTLSICLDVAPDIPGRCPWPIQLDTRGPTVRIFQQLGEGLLFRGRKIPHHRDRLSGLNSVSNLLLHYVDADFAGALD